jgi:hypothetical protein
LTWRKDVNGDLWPPHRDQLASVLPELSGRLLDNIAFVRGFGLAKPGLFGRAVLREMGCSEAGCVVSTIMTTIETPGARRTRSRDAYRGTPWMGLWLA